MLIDQEGMFLSQRAFPRMALLEVSVRDNHLAVKARGMDPLTIPIEPPPNRTVQATIWGDTVAARSYDGRIGAWFSAFLETPCRLVKFPDDGRRPVDGRYAQEGEHTAFADGYPFLLVSEASLDDLNQRLEHPVPMDRFRPNIVVRGCSPYAEDQWHTFRIGAVKFRIAKPCARCRVITVDQASAVPAEEPLRTLAQYRSHGTKVLFGQNLLHAGSGTLHVGDQIEIIEQGKDHGH